MKKFILGVFICAFTALMAFCLLVIIVGAVECAICVVNNVTPTVPQIVGLTFLLLLCGAFGSIWIMLDD